MTRLGRSISFILNIVLILLLLVACGKENDRYPRLEYIPTMWKADMINIKLEDGYTLRGYETIETEDGYDLIFSFEEEDGEKK